MSAQVHVQRNYRTRLRAAGKAFRIVYADFHPAKDGLFERDMVASMRDQLHAPLSKPALREDEAARLRERNAALEAELKTHGQHLTNALKDNVVLKQQLAQKRRDRPSK